MPQDAGGPLRRILVVDDARDFPDPGPFAGLVDAVAGAPPGGFEPDVYATAFVHANNQVEADWALEHYPVHFVFTGDQLVAPDVSDYEGVYELPRWALKQYFQAFLAAYARRGTVDDAVARTFYGF